MWYLVLVVVSVVAIVYFLTSLVKQGHEEHPQPLGEQQTILSKRLFLGTETHAIVVTDDDINTMEFVAAALEERLGISRTRATNLMLRIHFEGIAIVWTGSRNEAEYYLQRMKELHLRCFVTEITVG